MFPILSNRYPDQFIEYRCIADFMPGDDILVQDGVQYGVQIAEYDLVHWTATGGCREGRRTLDSF